MELIKAVYHLAINNNHIRFLYTEFIPLYKQYSENNDIYWWETPFWRNKKITPGIDRDNNIIYKDKKLKKEGMIVRRERIFNIIRQTIENYIDYIQNKIVQKDYIDIPKYDNSIILDYMYGVFEMIYDTQYIEGNIVTDGPKFRCMTPLKSYLYDNIIEIRNQAIHQKNISAIDLFKFIRAIFNLLRNEKNWIFNQNDIPPDNQGEILSVNKERNKIHIKSDTFAQYSIIIEESTFINNNKDNKLLENKNLENLIGGEVSFVIDTKIDSEDKNKRCIYLKSATLIQLPKDNCQPL